MCLTRVNRNKKLLDRQLWLELERMAVCVVRHGGKISRIINIIETDGDIIIATEYVVGNWYLAQGRVGRIPYYTGHYRYCPGLTRRRDRVKRKWLRRRRIRARSQINLGQE